MISVVLSDFFLSLRWRFLTKDKISLLASFEAIGISAFLNFLLPAKAGELSKIVYLKKFYNYRASRAMAVLFMERVFDVLLLGLLAMLTAIFLLDLEHSALYSTLLVVSIIAGFFLLKFIPLKKVFILVPNKVLRNFLFKTYKYTYELHSKEDLIKNFFYSALVWASYLMTTYLFFVCVAGFELDLGMVLIVFVISSVAMSLPLLPGGIGTYQAGVVFALGLYGVGKEEALVSGVVIHLLMLIPSFLIAWYVFVNKNIGIGFFKQ